MQWFRVDNRLVHGQIIEAWLPFTGVKNLIVANDALAQDLLRQQIMLLAVPQRVRTHFVPVAGVEQTMAACEGDAFVLLENCHDAGALAEAGVPIPVLNVGNLHHSEGKRQLLPHVAVDAAEEALLLRLAEQGVQLDFRSVPNETVRGLDARFL